MRVTKAACGLCRAPGLSLQESIVAVGPIAFFIGSDRCSGAANLAAETARPLMNATGNPARSMMRALIASWQPGSTTKPGSARSCRSSSVLVLTDRNRTLSGRGIARDIRPPTPESRHRRQRLGAYNLLQASPRNRGMNRLDGTRSTISMWHEGDYSTHTQGAKDPSTMPGTSPAPRLRRWTSRAPTIRSRLRTTGPPTAVPRWTSIARPLRGCAHAPPAVRCASPIPTFRATTTPPCSPPQTVAAPTSRAIATSTTASSSMPRRRASSSRSSRPRRSTSGSRRPRCTG